MRTKTVKTLRCAYLGAPNIKRLYDVYKTESNPFNKNSILDLIKINKKQNDPEEPPLFWNHKLFTEGFLSTKSPLEMLDATFFAFILQVAAIIKHDMYVRTFKKPGTWEATMSMINLFKNLLSCSLALLYNVKWTPKTIYDKLEWAILLILGNGDVSALRKLMTDLGIKLTRDDLFPGEIHANNLHKLNIAYSGSFYWRFLHWMAEAVDLRGDDMTFYKDQWRSCLRTTFYRSIVCSICKFHFKKLLMEHDTEIDGPLSKLFFDIHNKTNAHKAQTTNSETPQYTEDQYAADAKFMRQALSARQAL